MPKKKPYHHNNWQAYKDADDDMFKIGGKAFSYEEFMGWKVAGWELPSTVVCIIRETNTKGKVKEHVYKRHKAAQNKIIKLMNEGANFVVADDESIHDMFPQDAG